MVRFQYYFAQREPLETIIWLYDVAGAKDKFDLMRFDSSGAVSAQMFDESWRRYVVKLEDGRIVIVETKGLEDLDVPFKMVRLGQWCEDMNRVQSNIVYDFVFVDQEGFEKYAPKSFGSLLAGFGEYKK